MIKKYFIFLVTGYEWVGWKNTTRGKEPVEIIFYFDSVKNFSEVSFYVNNFFSKDVQVIFKLYKIHDYSLIEF